MDKDFFSHIENLGELLAQPVIKFDDEVLICECFCVSAGDIRSACPNGFDLGTLSTKLNLGQGCTKCLDEREDWVKRVF